jgi:hypothetical protein
MMRENTSTDSPFVSATATESDGVELRWCDNSGTTHHTDASTGTIPIWLEIVRSSNNFSAYYSSNDSTWVQVGATISLSASSQMLMGLAVASHTSTSKVAAATFTNVSYTGGAIAPTVAPLVISSATVDTQVTIPAVVTDTGSGIRLTR